MNSGKCLQYVSATARVKVKFPANKPCTCENCRFCISKYHDGVIYDEYCNLTDETLIKRKYERGLECPLIFNKNEG